MSRLSLLNLNAVVVARPVRRLPQPVLPAPVRAEALPVARLLAHKLVQFHHLPVVRNLRLRVPAVAAVRVAEPPQVPLL
jgi:hypothetical protein